MRQLQLLEGTAGPRVSFCRVTLGKPLASLSLSVFISETVKGL